MSPDTGAREPQPKPLWTLAALVDAGWGTLTAAERWTILRDLEAALAAGVGVPPDEDSGSAPARERQDARATPDFGRWFKESATWTGSDYLWLNRFRDLYLASGASAAEGRKPETPAGVGEARPEPRCHRCGGKLPLEGEAYDVRVTDYCCAKCAVEVVAGEARPAEPPRQESETLDSAASPRGREEA